MACFWQGARARAHLRDSEECMKNLTRIAVVAALAMWTTASLAEEHEEAKEREWGDKGVVGFGVETRLDALYTSIKSPNGDSSSSTQIGFGADIAYFVVDGLSVGGVVGFDHLSSKPAGATDSDTETSYNVMARVGYNLWLQPESLSLWPQVGIGWNHSGLGTSSGDASASQVQLGVFIPLLIHPAKHFHFGIGPFVTRDLTSSTSATPSGGSSTSGDGDKATVIGIRGDIAGWL
jgi:hypothetical protein